MTLMKTTREVGKILPSIVEKTTSFILQYGLQTQGLFRLSAAKRAVDRLITDFDINPMSVCLTPTDDIHAVCVVLKTWLRELPDPPISGPTIQQLIQKMKSDPALNHLDLIRATVANITSDLHRFLLQHICFTIRKVAEHQEHNKMTIPNLAIVFTPSLFRVDISKPEDNAVLFKIFETLITDYDALFSATEKELLARQELHANFLRNQP
jgi:hypothetical protein